MVTLSPKGNTISDCLYQIARAAGTDAGNRSMKKASRKVWNQDDYNVAANEMNRILDTVDKNE